VPHLARNSSAFWGTRMYVFLVCILGRHVRISAVIPNVSIGSCSLSVSTYSVVQNLSSESASVLSCLPSYLDSVVRNYGS
jgi:hypothetical protein